MKRAVGPLLVFGPRSTTYDFGPSHPLTPRRFGPGVDLLRSVGAEPGLAPEPASDPDLEQCHTPRYIATVRRFSADPFGLPEAGINHGGDNPAFAGMHEAAAAVAGGSLAAVEAILRGDVDHAFHPGGGLHHAMADRASGFCIYDDPALAIARARQAGLRVLYVDLDVHHGDGVEALHLDDPGVLTVSFHESGRFLFPGTGFPDELGDGDAAGTSINVPFEPYAGERSWLAAVERLVPALAAAFGPDLVVSQHGADAHAWDPLAHLRVTTTAMGAAARLVDAVAHRHAGGRWLATGGGGYDAYRVVPRTWSLVWLAGAHRDAPPATDEAWRERWAAEAARYGQAPLPARFDDPPNAGEPVDAQQVAADERSAVRAAVIREAVLPRLLVHAQDAGWWRPLDPVPAGRSGEPPASAESTAGPTIVRLDPATLDRLRLAPRVIPPAEADAGHALLAAALRASEGAPDVVAAVASDVIVGLAIVGGGRSGGRDGGAPSSPAPDALLGLGVAPAFRRRGLATALLRAAVSDRPRPVEALVTLAERDPVEPFAVDVRRAVARRLLEGAGLAVEAADGTVGQIDRGALVGRRK